MYRATRQPMTEAAWAVRVQIKPYVNWIWLGCLLMAAGGFWCASDRRYRRGVRASQAGAAATAGRAA